MFSYKDLDVSAILTGGNESEENLVSNNSNQQESEQHQVQQPQQQQQSSSSNIKIQDNNEPSRQHLHIERDNVENDSLVDKAVEDFSTDIKTPTIVRQYRFKISINEFNILMEDSIVEEKSSKHFRYLTGDFMRVFEKHLETFEKVKVLIQKRNNIVYEEPSRTSTVYVRINGDCKLCPKGNRVKFVFTIKKKPTGIEKFIDIDTKARGTHSHSGISIIHTDLTPSVNQNLENFSSTTTNNGNNEPSTSTSFTLNELNVTSKTQSNNTNNVVGLNTSNNLSKSTTNAKPFLLNKTQANTSSNNLNQQHGTLISNRKRRLNEDDINHTENLLNTDSTSLTTQSIGNLDIESSSSSLPVRLNLNDRLLVNQIASQISNKIMIKLDQINLKVNQINDRLYELERKLENIDMPQFQQF